MFITGCFRRKFTLLFWNLLTQSLWHWVTRMRRTFRTHLDFHLRAALFRHFTAHLPEDNLMNLFVFAIYPSYLGICRHRGGGWWSQAGLACVHTSLGTLTHWGPQLWWDTWWQTWPETAREVHILALFIKYSTCFGRLSHCSLWTLTQTSSGSRLSSLWHFSSVTLWQRVTGRLVHTVPGNEEQTCLGTDFATGRHFLDGDTEQEWWGLIWHTCLPKFSLCLQTLLATWLGWSIHCCFGTLEHSCFGTLWHTTLVTFSHFSILIVSPVCCWFLSGVQTSSVRVSHSGA